MRASISKNKILHKKMNIAKIGYVYIMVHKFTYSLMYEHDVLHGGEINNRNIIMLRAFKTALIIFKNGSFYFTSLDN